MITSWHWDFDDGDTSVDQNPIHIYPIGDTFMVNLTVRNDLGCEDDTTITLPILQGPIPDFIFDTVCFGDSTTFLDNSTNGAGVNASWTWQFGTGDSSTLQNPVYLFPNDTVFNVQLTVVDTNNCVARVDRDVLVFTNPTADYTTSDLCFRSAINFTDQSAAGSNPIAAWYWDFDDNGATSNQQNPAHNFSNPGNYGVQLVAEDSRGCVDTLVRNLFINPQPVGDFLFSRDIACVGEQVCLTDSSTASGSTGGIGSWAWDFEFNSGIDNTNQNPCTTYNTAGTYTVRLIVTDTNQCRDTVDRQIRVFDLPTADFDWAVSCVDSPMIFTDFSIPGDTTITNWLWDFGDAVQDIVQNPQHVYATPGSFNVNLQVTDANGCIDDITKPVSVDFRPDVNAQSSQTICWGESVVLSATGATTYTWEPNVWYQPLIATGDSIVATPLNTITYTVTAFNGVCPPDDTSLTITVIPTRPLTLEHRGPDSVIANMGTELFADISGLIDSIRWDPDSTLSCTDCRNPVAAPSQSTTYTATIYYSLNGVVCTQSDVISVSVNGNCPQDLLFVPTGFSPNGDGNNDILYVRGIGIERVNYFRIFDRWGNLMYQVNDVDANDRSIGWDGTEPGGAQLNPGVFVYVAEVVCSNGDVLTQTGNVTLIK
jgi:gliding motility-associated-like protein